MSQIIAEVLHLHNLRATNKIFSRLQIVFLSLFFGCIRKQRKKRN